MMYKCDRGRYTWRNISGLYDELDVNESRRARGNGQTLNDQYYAEILSSALSASNQRPLTHVFLIHSVSDRININPRLIAQLQLTHTETAAQAPIPTSQPDKHAPYAPDRHSQCSVSASSPPQVMDQHRGLAGCLMVQRVWRVVEVCERDVARVRRGDPM